MKMSSMIMAMAMAMAMAMFVKFVSSDPETFIVHVSRSEKPSVFRSHRDWYSSTLGSFPGSKLLYAYEVSIHGFAARMSGSQARELGRLPHVVSVVPEQIRQVHTTRTPHFLGLADSFGIWPNSDYADDVIVGVLDTGIWPERSSFNDSGLSGVPGKWKGVCEFEGCNRKIIGARAFYKGYEAAKGDNIDWSKESKSPRDTEGHGTHTSSTAAGSYVSKAGFYEYAVGEARGMATKARIAMYKICWSPGCFDSDILAAMDQAVADGVDVISLSVGSSYNAPYDHDSIAVGAFGAAVHNGVVVSCSAGNSGPDPYTATNIAPWILTVGASSLDREFPADVILGDTRVFPGVSLYSGAPLDTSQSIPLVYAADCGSRFCYAHQLNASRVAGKIVICDRGGNARVAKGDAVRIAGGVGMILANTQDAGGEELIADSHLIPATTVGQMAGDKIRDYARSQPLPTAHIEFRGTVIGPSPPAPKVASFSSRGPNSLTPEILKPDVIAPGLNILAAWTGSAAPTDLDIDPRRVEFNIISGTSMSCPHVSGLAALLRKAFPKWTPAAIKSALMTTAHNLDNSGMKIQDLASDQESTPFIHGAGHVDPNAALNPGLVYDLHAHDYIAFLCSIGYDSNRISVFTRDPTTVDCNSTSLATPGDLNYPSFSVLFKSNNDQVSYKRVVNHVGSEVDAIYKANVVAPPSVEVTVSPSTLVFSQNLRSSSYVVTFKSIIGKGKELESVAPAFGSLEWSDSVHLVRSPIAVRWSNQYVSSM